MKKLFLLHFVFLTIAFNSLAQDSASEGNGYRLVWSDEFDYAGPPDPVKWTFEHGFVRNMELQWYQPDNAWVEAGVMRITARRERKANPAYNDGSADWRENRPYAEYTSAAVVTTGMHQWLYGRFEIRARIPAVKGSWPAIWFRGDKTHRPWPLCGEIDLMEYYRIDDEPTLLANACWGDGVWDSSYWKVSGFAEKDDAWEEEFHIWRMEWTEDYIRLYVDDMLLNEIDVTKTLNPDGVNPFRLPMHMLINLAVGRPGESPDDTPFPLYYDIDYVRVYQK